MPSGLSKETTQMLKLHCTTSLGRGDLSLVAGGACPRTFCKHCQMPHYLCTASWSGSPSELSSSTGVTAGTAWRETGRKSSRWRFFCSSSYSRHWAWGRPLCHFCFICKAFLGSLGYTELSYTFPLFHFYLARLILIWISSSDSSSFVHLFIQQIAECPLCFRIKCELIKFLPLFYSLVEDRDRQTDKYKTAGPSHGRSGIEEGSLEDVAPNLRPEGWAGVSPAKRGRGRKRLRFLGQEKREGLRVPEDLKMWEKLVYLECLGTDLLFHINVISRL